MSRTVTRLFDRYEDAEAAVGELEALGVPGQDISLVANNADSAHSHRVPDGKPDTAPQEAAEDAGKGAGVGGVVGGLGGLLAGIGVMAIPGLGPVVAAGWLVSTAVGAVAGAAVGAGAGGLIRALTHPGVREEDAHVHAEGVRRGGVLVSVRASDGLYDRITAILDRANGAEAGARGRLYREDGWAPRYGDEPRAPERIEGFGGNPDRPL